MMTATLDNLKQLRYAELEKVFDACPNFDPSIGKPRRRTLDRQKSEINRRVIMQNFLARTYAAQLEKAMQITGSKEKLEAELAIVAEMRSNCVMEGTTLPEGMSAKDLFDERHGTTPMAQLISIYEGFGLLPSAIAKEPSTAYKGCWKFITKAYLEAREKIAQAKQDPSITELDLSQNHQGITNTDFLYLLPKGIEGLTQLTTLKLFWHRLHALPPELSALTNLQHLELGCNHFEAFPNVIQHFTQLKYLGLNHSSKIKTFPSGLQELKHLKKILMCDWGTKSDRTPAEQAALRDQIPAGCTIQFDRR